MPVRNPPDGYHSVSPYLLTPDVNGLIAFLRESFGAAEVERHQRPDGSIGHAEVRIGDSIVMMGGAQPDWPPSPAHLYVYLDDVDAAYARALRAGGTSVREPALQYYGDRMGGVKDPFGNTWWIATHVEDVAPDEMARRASMSG
jgi:uncharacterized glyoxalase superfamily protein PhnB